MIALNPAIGTRLEWQQPKAFQRYYELTADGEVTGTLRFEKSFGTLATADYGLCRWTFKRAGFWCPRVSVREEGSTVDTAIFMPKWKGGGDLSFQSGRSFTLKSVSFWGSQWTFETEDGAEIVSVHGPHGIVHSKGEVSVGLLAGKLAETPLLLMLIWYLRLLMQEEAATVTAVTAG